MERNSSVSLVLCIVLLGSIFKVCAQQPPPTYVNTNAPGAAEQRTPVTRFRMDLTATATAPKGSYGSVVFDRSSGTNATVIVEVEGLTPGDYTVSAVESTKREPIELGQIGVRRPDLGPETNAGASRKQDNNSQQSDVIRSRTELLLPGSFLPASIDRVTISDSAGHAVLIGHTKAQ